MRLDGEPLAEPEGGGELHGFRGTNALDFGDLRDAASRECAERSEFPENLAREFHGIHALHADAQQDGD